jgi:plasmid stability protein
MEERTMATLTIRNIPPEIYDRLREQAKRHRRSITQEAAFIIEQALRKTEPSEEIWHQVDRVRDLIRTRYGTFPDSTVLTREDRQR